jgi:hypothetical protein
MNMNTILAQANNNSAAGAAFGIGFVFLALSILYGVAWLYAVITAATRSDFDSTKRLIWILVLIFLPGIGTLLYFLLNGTGRA